MAGYAGTNIIGMGNDVLICLGGKSAALIFVSSADEALRIGGLLKGEIVGYVNSTC